MLLVAATTPATVAVVGAARLLVLRLTLRRLVLALALLTLWLARVLGLLEGTLGLLLLLREVT